MVRMSDLVRGIVRESPPAPLPERPAPPERSAEPAEVTPMRLMSLASLGTPSSVERDDPVPAEPEPRVPEPTAESPEPLFGEIQAFLGEAQQRLRGGGAFPWGRLQALVDRAITALARSADLFWVANNPAVPAGVDYLAFHQARVAVLAMTIGASVGYDRPRRRQLGVAGSLIDVGLWQVPESLLRRLDALSAEEQTLYRSHPRLSVELIRRWSPPREGLVEAVLQHHEREQGQGFPQGLHGTVVSPDAKVLGLVDTYTALTMPPPPRPRLRPHEAIREIVRSKHEAFPAQLVKALLSEISVFPPGTLVRLNTGEVGRVTAVNRNHPLRPRVEVVADGKGQRLASPKITDLADAPFLYITGAVAEGGR